MRARDFLLEYSREKTAQVFGNKLLKAFSNDPRPTPQLGHVYAYVRQKMKIGGEMPVEKEQYVIDLLMQTMEAGDPTPNKEYTQWLAKCYANEKVPAEDIVSNGMDALKNYHQFKLKKLLPAEWRNIANLTWLQMAMIAHDPDLVAKLEAAEDAKADKGKIDTLLDNDQVRIIIPLDEAAAKYYGQGTRWCTAAKNNNMFSRYASDGDLYILLPKQPKHDGEKYQLHFESDQFMDEDDSEVNVYEIMYIRFGNLVPIFKQRAPELGNYVIFRSDEELAPVLEKLKELGYEWMNEWTSEIEGEDYEWQEQIARGQTDDGDIDWDAVGFDGYLDWNTDLADRYNELEDAITVSPQRARELAAIYNENGYGMWKFDDLEKVIADNLKYQAGDARRRYKNGDLLYKNFANWYEENIVTTATGARLIQTPNEKKFRR